jgi:broad specificity phosphatase PhoE
MTEPLKLFLIRHGETAWSISGQHTGRTDIPLTQRGEDQARGLARYVGRFIFTHVMTSPLQRARRTCELAGLGQSAVDNSDLEEWDYGAYEGQRSSDIQKHRPDWSRWEDGCPNGEMPAQISARADRLVTYLNTLHGNVALFSHGHFSCALAARWIGWNVDQGQHFVLDPASVSILASPTHHARVRAIQLWNATQT